MIWYGVFIIDRVRVVWKKKCVKDRLGECGEKPKVRWGRVILALVILIVLVGGIGFGLWRGYQAAVSYFGGSATTETTTTADVAPPSEPNQVSTIPLEQKSLDKPIYILLVGKDSNNPAQGDALFLLSVNEQQKIN